MIVNALGHTAGVLIFGNFLWLLLRNSSFRRGSATKLAFIAGALAFIWNFAWLGVLITGQPYTLLGQAIATVAFCSLSLLPAVLLHISLWERFPTLVKAGYLVSGIAAAAHAIEVFHSAEVYHSFGLIVITLGFGFLTIVAVLRTLWSGENNRRSAISRFCGAMSVFLFAISFVHFSEGESPKAWFTELLFHHAGIPLALFILIQDYRFVFLDAFIRFLANGLLAGLFGLAIALATTGLSLSAQTVIAGILLTLFAVTRAAALRFLSRIVFREVNTDAVITRIQALASRASNDQEYIAAASREIAAEMNTRLIESSTTVLSGDVLVPTLAANLPEARYLHAEGVEVIVPIRQSNEISMVLLGQRRSGRRYLSKDLDDLARIAAHVAQQADQIRKTEIRRLAVEAELRALQAQIHPHFLFNALNTLYGVIPRDAHKAKQTLISLSEVLRYFLRSERTYIPLAEEIRVIKEYLAIESLRLGTKLKTKIEVEDGISNRLIPTLSIEPLVENAVKHGIARRSNGGEIRVEVRRRSRGIQIEVWDSGPGFATSIDSPEHAGIGLRNVSRRLELCYGPGSQLDICSTDDGTSVRFWVPPADEADTVRSTVESARQ